MHDAAQKVPQPTLESAITPVKIAKFDNDNAFVVKRKCFIYTNAPLCIQFYANDKMY